MEQLPVKHQSRHVGGHHYEVEVLPNHCGGLVLLGTGGPPVVPGAGPPWMPGQPVGPSRPAGRAASGLA
uniref:Uncharacterized protein n=1 Tax=Anguilla anguilla TaxID=7936 RepID=A0A0E9TDA2_ANGAN